MHKNVPHISIVLQRKVNCSCSLICFIYQCTLNVNQTLALVAIIIAPGYQLVHASSKNMSCENPHQDIFDCVDVHLNFAPYVITPPISTHLLTVPLVCPFPAPAHVTVVFQILNL